jgi:hypothetical protein
VYVFLLLTWHSSPSANNINPFKLFHINYMNDSEIPTPSQANTFTSMFLGSSFLGDNLNSPQNLSYEQPPMQRNRAASVILPPGIRHSRMRTLSVADASLYPAHRITGESRSFNAIDNIRLSDRRTRKESLKPLSPMLEKDQGHFKELLVSQSQIIRVTDPETALAALAMAGIVYEDPYEPKVTLPLTKPANHGLASSRQKQEWGSFNFKSLLPQSEQLSNRQDANTAKKRVAGLSKVNLINHELDLDVIYPRTAFNYTESTTDLTAPLSIKEQIFPSLTAIKPTATKLQKLYFSRPNTGYTVNSRSRNCAVSPKQANPPLSTPVKPVHKPILKIPTSITPKGGVVNTTNMKVMIISQVQIGQHTQEHYLIVPRDASDPFYLKKAAFKQVCVGNLTLGYRSL